MGECKKSYPEMKKAGPLLTLPLILIPENRL